MYSFNKEDYMKRMEWYTQARFGMFLHWGLYSIPARLSLITHLTLPTNREV